MSCRAGRDSPLPCSSKVLEQLALGRIEGGSRTKVRLGVFVKVTAVALISDPWHNGRSQFTRVHIVPVEVLEPTVFLDVVGSPLHVSDTFRPVEDEQLLYQVLGYGVHVLWPLRFAAEDLLVDAEWIVIVERRVSYQHFVDEHTWG